jgi:acyl-homoserine-lactone acylase
MKYLLFLLAFPLQIFAQSFSASEIESLKKRAANITIMRDNWGIPHVYGKTDADAVFGLLYAQCEDDFKRVEMNYIEKLGRKAEVNGETYLYNDLYIRLIIDSADAVADYHKSPLWLKQLLNAWADGINYYLHTHPQVKPALLSRFKPWYPLLWTDGSIGAISTGDVTEQDVKSFYSSNLLLNSVTVNAVDENDELIITNKERKHVDGSNGFAIAPSKTESGKCNIVH